MTGSAAEDGVIPAFELERATPGDAAAQVEAVMAAIMRATGGRPGVASGLLFSAGIRLAFEAKVQPIGALKTFLGCMAVELRHHGPGTIKTGGER